MSTMAYVNVGAGYLGLLVAAASVVWQVHTHRKSKTERADAKLSFETATGENVLCVTVVNTGEPPLYIKEVELVATHRNPEQKLASGKKSALAASAIQFQPVDTETGPLQPGNQRKYVFREEFARGWYVSQDPSTTESLWVSVKTPKGEVGRIERVEVLPFL